MTDLHLFEELPDYFPKWLHHVAFLSAVFESSDSSTSSPTLVINCLLECVPNVHS